MFSKARLITSLLFLLFLTAHTAEAKKEFDWEGKKHAGRFYVPLDRVKVFYGYSLVTSGRKIYLTNKGKVAKEKVITIQFSSGGQEVIMNGVKFIFSFPIIAIGGKYHLSDTDLKKILDPVLRPNYIENAKPFRTVVIDPGHGGRDPGCVNSLGTEAEYNLNVAEHLKKELLKMDFRVVMTRDSNRFVSLSQRVAIANRYPDAIFVSIHFNSVDRSARSRARGIETFTLSPEGVAHYGRSIKASDFLKRTGNYQDSANIALATAVHWQIIRSLANHPKGPKVVIPDRGIRRARFKVLNGVKHPAILIEGGFMSHPTEARYIDRKSYQTTMAEAIARAIRYYQANTSPKNRKR